MNYLNWKRKLWHNFSFELGINRRWQRIFRRFNSKQYVIVATLEEKIIGYLAGSINEKGSYEEIHYGEINNMFIQENYRLYGIGKKLINTFKDYCRNNNISNLKVVASSKNKNAIDFYRKNGFDDFNLTLTMNIGD